MAELSPGERIRDFFISLLQGLINLEDTMISKMLEPFEGRVDPEVLVKIRESSALRKARWSAIPFIPPGILEEVEAAVIDETLQSQFELIMLDIAKVFAVLQFGMAPAGIDAGYRAEHELETGRFDPSTAAAMHHRGIIDFAAYEENLADLGFNADQRKAWLYMIRERPMVGDYIRWSYRIQDDPERARAELKLRGMKPDDIEVLFELSHLIPGPGDLVRFALREVWKPDMRAEQLSPDAPGEYYDWMQKIGYDRDHAASFWAAHWVLPAVGHGYEMFHRLDDFTESDLRALMTRLDILPKYHDGLIRIAHPTISRVDIRRIYRDLPAGAVDVYRRHLDLGYSPADAELMATWVQKEYVADITEPLKSDVLGAYGDDLIGRDAALKMLLDIGMDPWAAEIALDRKDIAKAKKLSSEIIRQTKTLYVNEDYNTSDVHAALGAINLPASRIERLLQEWNITKAGKVARPSVAKLEGYFFRDIIDHAAFVDHLKRHKYGEPYITWAVQDIQTRKMEALVKEEERAAKEAERVAKLEVKTAYEEARAAINYEIAQLKVHLLEIRLFIERLGKGPERRELMGIIGEAQEEIARIEVEIEEKHANLTTQRTILRTLAVKPDMETLYTMIDDAQIAITNENEAIAKLRAVIIEVRGQIRRALPGAEVETQRQVIDDILIDIALESVDIAKLRLVVAARKTEIAETWTSEDIAELEEEMRVIRLLIASLEADRARLKL